MNRVSRTKGPLDEDGFALVAVLILLIAMMSLAAAMQLAGRTEIRIGTNHYIGTQAYYAAEAGAERFLALVSEKMANGNLTPEMVAEAAATPPTIPDYKFVEYSAVLAPSVVARQIPQGPFAGLTSLDRDLTVTSSVEGPNGARATVIMDARAQAIPIFQFAAFYEEDLENFPGPRMDIRGRVHTNGDLWIDSITGLYLWGMVTTAKDIHIEAKASGGDPSSDGRDVYIRKNDGTWVEVLEDSHAFGADHDPLTFPTPAQDQAFDDWSKSTWDHNIQTRASGVLPLKLPIPEGVDPYELIQPCTGAEQASLAAVKYACNSGLQVRVRGTALEVLNEGGAPEAMPPGAVAFAINRFYDDREQSSSAGNGDPIGADNSNSDRDVIEIDLDAFDVANYKNGLIYVTADATNPGGPDAVADEQQYTVRVRGGRTLKAPLTIATDLPLYVLGDYNNVNSQWQPASFASDAIYILSNNWSDGAAGEAARPQATRTEVQAAILAGHSPTPFFGSPNGGGWLNNFPRFLETWSGLDCTISGSLVSLWFAQKAVGPYHSHYYSPPNRDWHFDQRFNDPANLPPFTPVVGQVLRMGFARRY
jgi:hypothetical protein